MRAALRNEERSVLIRWTVASAMLNHQRNRNEQNSNGGLARN